VEPELKRQLYAALALSGLTLKDWFVQSAGRYCNDCLQGDLFKATLERKEGAQGRARRP
jgi:hypothetical protein